MGVPGLWALLRDAAVARSLTDLAVTDGFIASRTHHALRIGIDVSIWFVHAEYGREGENPELRTIFFRLTRLLQLPVLVLFVFDGPLRPEMKRGKLIDTKPNWMIDGLKSMIDAFGFEWRTAPGEAEAELAYLNRIGIIDAVLTDDVDTLVFGASLVIRNQSKNLSGNKAHDLTNADGRDDKNHTMTFALADVKRHPKVNLTQGGLILIALLSGGDYSKGLDGCGIALAAGLARCGFGDTLLTAVRSLSPSIVASRAGKLSKTRVTLAPAESAELARFLKGWRSDLCAELRANAQKHLPKRSPTLAARVESGAWDLDVDVLLAYVHPVTSEERAVTRALARSPSADIGEAKRAIADELKHSIGAVWARGPDIGAVARVCEDRFEWGVREVIVKRFRSWLWPGIVCSMLRHAAMNDIQRGARLIRTEEDDDNGPPLSQRTQAANQLSALALSPSTPSSAVAQFNLSVLRKIHSARTHASTDGLLEYRLEVVPTPFVRAAEAGVEGRRALPRTGWTDSESDSDGPSSGECKTGNKGKAKAKKPADSSDPVRVWMPACMVHAALPALATAFDERQTQKAKGKTKKAAAGASRTKGSGQSKANANAGLEKKQVRSRVLTSSDSERRGETAPPPSSPVRKKIVLPASMPLFVSDTDENDLDDELDAAVVRPSLRTVQPSIGPNFFKASKRTTTASKQNAAENSEAKPRPKLKSKHAPEDSDTQSTVARVASLFADPEVQLFRDLTKKSEPQPTKLKPRAKADTRTARTLVTAALTVPKAKPKQQTGSDYIEISSDDDVTAPAPPPPPSRPALRQPIAADVIDLCSDSE